MNKLVSIAAACVLATPLLAQDEAVIETPPTAVEAARAAQRKLETEQAAPEGTELKKELVYGGFLTDLRRAERKSRLLSLRQPRDPKNDYKNVHLDERTARPKGFVLFSIGF